MLFTGVVVIGSGCSTGCPILSCLNPWCRERDSIYSIRRYEVGLPEAFMPYPLPIWDAELQRTPRRMKRPFPANKPAPARAHRRPCY